MSRRLNASTNFCSSSRLVSGDIGLLSRWKHRSCASREPDSYRLRVAELDHILALALELDVADPPLRVDDPVDYELVAAIDDIANVNAKVVPRVAQPAKQAANRLATLVDPLLGGAGAWLVVPHDVGVEVCDGGVEVVRAEEAEGVGEARPEGFLRIPMQLAF